ncbi:hypothetical protein HCAG_05021 [Histoplasma mississippiense (nom. inval.)]|uniref:hypothetical protein n=1 Tax=Ajellomyces capsulatus (strain NAm1 / WU24) TaxID=2059318 RepID=UPI000157C4FC|nr:hypothetical protein HCAG_05021 [Histoplasma mississippiense (nom. inval.)]EDN08522.1 hypothetical protein HCAG_05021 [Histoplasma mississippiense (nom. inval.)]
MAPLVTISTCSLNQWVLDFEGNTSRIIESIRIAKAAGARWFTSWAKPRYVEDYYLERIVGEITGQATVPIGDAVISTYDSAIGIETCEELFTPNNPGIHMGLNGVEIFTNSSGSHHELRKLKQRIDLIRHCTRGGGIYLYANQRGEDGNGRLYFDGSAGIFVNGRVVGMSSQFSLKDVDVVTAVVDLEEVRSTRTSVSRSSQGSQAPAYQRIEAPISLSRKSDLLNPNVKPSPDIELEYHSPEEEIALGPACWLWDYLRRSRQSGFFASVAIITFSMCRLVVSACRDGNQAVIADMRRIVGVPEDSHWLPDTPQELCGKILHTCYMATTNSSKETRNRAKQLAKSIGSYHIDLDMDSVVSAISNLFTFVTNFTPRFSVHGGTATENLALQSKPANSGIFKHAPASLLAICSLSFCLWYGRGQGDLPSLFLHQIERVSDHADLNPIGSIDKSDLINFLTWAKVNFDIPIIESFVHAIPTAELEPITENYTQSDEDQMGMTYAELSLFGRLRKISSESA